MKVEQFFKDLVFEPISHSYKIEDTKLDSVSSLVSSFEEEFDIFWTVYIALKESGYDVKRVGKDISINKKIFKINNISDLIIKLDNSSLAIKPKDIKEKWRIENLVSKIKGTICHLYMECLYKEQEFIYPDSIVTVEKERILNSFTKIKILMDKFYKENTHLKYIASEVKLYSKELGIAGTCDIIFFDENQSKYVIYDWKTNKKFDSTGFFSKMKGSLSHLKSCELVKYSLQLGIYNHLLKDKLDTGDPVIVWFNEKAKDYKLFKTIPFNNVESIIQEYHLQKL